jgi:hypothetical protein
MAPTPQIPGGIVVSIVGIINGAINAIVPQLNALDVCLAQSHRSRS